MAYHGPQKRTDPIVVDIGVRPVGKREKAVRARNAQADLKKRLIDMAFNDVRTFVNCGGNDGEAFWIAMWFRMGFETALDKEEKWRYLKCEPYEAGYQRGLKF